MSTADPDAFGPFLVLGRLGAGGMGTVYLGRSPGGRRVAIKTIRADQAAAPGVRERFRREVDAARRMGGFWTAPVVQADPDAATPWVATAYLDAPDLDQHVQRQGPLPVAELLSLAAGLAEALAAIHKAGLIHRDLKPANVLITEDGPRVIDFGIARADTADVTLTTLGGILGTPGYMSPEQANGEVTGPASDVFSLGALLYYAATGSGPFGHGTVPALLYRVVNDDPNLTPVPNALRPVLVACFDKEPEHRPSAMDVLTLLSRPLTAMDTGRPPTQASGFVPQGLAWWEQPTHTAYRAPAAAPPPAAPARPDPPADSVAWWSVGADADPEQPATLGFATGSPVAEAYRAEQYAVDRGRAPGPRVDALEPGDVVEHTEFGIGTVLEVTGAGSQAVALVSFGAKGRRKRLLLRYAPMRKIGT
ncbi:serine/threonine-protein kinase [Streptomyces phaeochromogenes]